MLPSRIVIVGAGQAAAAAIDTLRRKGFTGAIALVGEEDSCPYQRPPLSKKYLAGALAHERLLIRPPHFYTEHAIEMHLGRRVTRIDRAAQRICLDDGTALPYDELLLATGSRPRALSAPGADLPGVHFLRTVKDVEAIRGDCARARHVVIVGGGYIGLEVAATCRELGLDTTVLEMADRTMNRVTCPEVSAFVQAEHARHGVNIVCNMRVRAIAADASSGRARAVICEDGTEYRADLVVVGVGVRPRLTLAEKCGLALDRGVTVNAYLETSVAGIYAGGDIARWPDPHSREKIRVEHWVVAERQGQTAARNMLGQRERFDAVPFFWSQHYDVPINYVGHAETWDEIAVDGDIAAKDCLLRYKNKGRVLAVASIYRDLASLKAELEMERATR